MKKTIASIALAGAAMALPAAAHAQDAGADITIGVSGGYHDLGVDGDVEDAFPGAEIDDGSAIIGGFIAADFLVSENVFIGAEGNYHFGTGAIDSEYGASIRLGVTDAGGAKYYVRGGYQEVELDYAEIITVDGITFDDDDFIGLDDTEGDYLVGAGVEFPMGESTMLRVNLDTISFDTVRATAGFAFRF
ncbi:outer membrane beta-barrel protein [Aurantiacibacter gangjinensis]|uniref:outer membrane beta-barrel protein n=1 Tax=Aurantiacibacter gangjinensis TaxID=502682 RepID=UPI00069B9572|nr:outer membrane beta-barrel protein [Aurantiacibacter gangjinensis]APE28645.1 hypothetical protein BMF35_a1816 [Aurantiacibacter gangjinensis]